MPRLSMVLLLAFAAMAFAAEPQPQARELRALWVDGFHAGIRTPEEAAQLVAHAQRAHFNALFVQVRRRGDSLYRRSLEPFVEDAPSPPDFDPLAYIIELAHQQGIQVHAWINATPVWREEQPPHDPAHVFNRHGLAAPGEENWLTSTLDRNYRFPVGYFLDPGHPAAAAYMAQVYLNVVRNYAVDGIHFDYIRYPEILTDLQRGAPVGYNPVSLDRFRATTGRSDMPAPDDPEWTRWRRQQVTQLVRRVYIEAKALNPRLRVSAAVIAWERPPKDERDFENVAPMQRIFQDWHGWMREGILDMAVPMNYARERDARVRGWFDGWIRWEKEHKHGRQVAIGLGAYLNSPDEVLAQLARARNGSGRKHADGTSFFSYATMFLLPPAATGEQAVVQPAAASATAPVDRVAYLNSVFAQPATIPTAAYLEAPECGWVAGIATASGKPADGAQIELRRAGWALFSRTQRVPADGNGFFGFSSVKPGKYVLRVGEGAARRQVTVHVAAGEVTRAQLQF